MRWLRDLERKIEARLEGTGGDDMHVLEAAHLASGVILDSCSRPHRGLTVAPNLIFVPFKNKRKISPNFEDEVAGLLTEEIKQRGYRILAPLNVKAVGPEAEISSIVADWVDSQGRVAYGYVEGVEGPACGGLWAIAKEGAVIGRGSDADVKFSDSEMSRLHLEVKVIGEGRLLVEDLGSRNGTRVGKKAIAEPTRVKSGARIAVGTSVLRLWTLPWTENSLSDDD